MVVTKTKTGVPTYPVFKSPLTTHSPFVEVGSGLHGSTRIWENNVSSTNLDKVRLKVVHDQVDETLVSPKVFQKSKLEKGLSITLSFG